MDHKFLGREHPGRLTIHTLVYNQLVPKTNLTMALT